MGQVRLHIGNLFACGSRREVGMPWKKCSAVGRTLISLVPQEGFEPPTTNAGIVHRLLTQAFKGEVFAPPPIWGPLR